MPLPRPSWSVMPWRRALLVLTLVFLALSFVGCDDGRTTASVRPATEAETQAERDLAAKREQVARLAQDNEGKAKTIAELNERISAREQIIATARADIDSLNRDKRLMREEQIAAVLGWTAAALFLVALAAAIAAWLSPIGKRTLLSLAVVAGILAPVTLAARAYVHWLPYVGLAVVALAVGAALWAWRRSDRAGVTAAAQLKLFASQLAALDPDLKARVDRLSLAEQDMNGGRGLLDILLQRAPTPALPPLAGGIDFDSHDLQPATTDAITRTP